MDGTLAARVSAHGLSPYLHVAPANAAAACPLLPAARCPTLRLQDAADWGLAVPLSLPLPLLAARSLLDGRFSILAARLPPASLPLAAGRGAHACHLPLAGCRSACRLLPACRGSGPRGQRAATEKAETEEEREGEGEADTESERERTETGSGAARAGQ